MPAMPEPQEGDASPPQPDQPTVVPRLKTRWVSLLPEPLADPNNNEGEVK
jgi:hypothetical protein